MRGKSRGPSARLEHLPAAVRPSCAPHIAQEKSQPDGADCGEHAGGRDQGQNMLRTVVWISENSFKPSHSNYKTQLESFGCSVKCYKSCRNAERALDKKRGVKAVDPMVFLVSGAEASAFVAYASHCPVLDTSTIVVYDVSCNWEVPRETLCHVEVVHDMEDAVAKVGRIIEGLGLCESVDEAQKDAAGFDSQHQPAYFYDFQDQREDSAQMDTTDFPGVTTLFIKNVFRTCTRDLIASVLDNNGLCSSYDFVYLPFKFETGENTGYAFINFVSLRSAELFTKEFPDFYCQICDDSEPCTITKAHIQGSEGLIQAYRNSPVMHESVPTEFQPLLLRGGKPVDFPLPTKQILPPKRKMKYFRSSSEQPELQENDSVAHNLEGKRVADLELERRKPSKAPRLLAGESRHTTGRYTPGAAHSRTRISETLPPWRAQAKGLS